MNINNTTWNRIRYSIYAPFYDLAENLVGRGRKQSLGQIQVQPGSSVLIVGCGTGLDLAHLPKDIAITAIDVTPAMVDRARKRAKKLGLKINAQVMDAEQLEFPDETFDYVILHLILAVIPDPVACITESTRVLRPTGRIAIFDKFVPNNQSPSPLRKLANLLTNLLFSDITRKLEPLLELAGLELLEDRPALLGKAFRTAVAAKAKQAEIAVIRHAP